jgi:hypothetical protein
MKIPQFFKVRKMQNQIPIRKNGFGEFKLFVLFEIKTNSHMGMSSFFIRQPHHAKRIPTTRLRSSLLPSLSRYFLSLFMPTPLSLSHPTSPHSVSFSPSHLSSFYLSFCPE